MENEKELIVALIKLLESEMRIIEGDIILQQMQTKEIENTNVIDIFDINNFDSFMKAIDTKMKFIRSFYQKEGMYEAYSKVCELIEKYSNNNIKN